MSIKAKLIAGLGIALAPWLLTLPASAAEEAFGVTSVITVPNTTQNTQGGLGSFDISFVDPVAGVYILADRSNFAVDVVDTASNQVIRQLQANFVGPTGAHGAGPNGVLIANHTKVWAGDGNSLVKVIQLHNGKLVGSPISTGGTMRADELCWDSKDHIILIANPDEPFVPATPPFTSAPFVTFIDSDTHAILGKIVMDGTTTSYGFKKPLATGGIEQCQWDARTGKFYLNVPQANGTPNHTPPDGTDNLVLQIDPVSEHILNRVNVTGLGCLANHGMSIGPKPQIGLGCTGASTASVIINEDFGPPNTNPAPTQIGPALTNETGTDENWFNPGDNHYFYADSGHMPPNLGIVDALGETGLSTATPAEDVQTSPSLNTAAGSHSVAADPVGNQVYVPIRCTQNTAGNCVGTPAICSSNGGTGDGCIAVFTVVSGTDDPGSCTQQGGNNGNCPPKGQNAQGNQKQNGQGQNGQGN